MHRIEFVWRELRGRMKGMMKAFSGRLAIEKWRVGLLKGYTRGSVWEIVQWIDYEKWKERGMNVRKGR